MRQREQLVLTKLLALLIVLESPALKTLKILFSPRHPAGGHKRKQIECSPHEDKGWYKLQWKYYPRCSSAQFLTPNHFCPFVSEQGTKKYMQYCCICVFCGWYTAHAVEPEKKPNHINTHFLQNRDFYVGGSLPIHTFLRLLIVSEKQDIF